MRSNFFHLWYLYYIGCVPVIISIYLSIRSNKIRKDLIDDMKNAMENKEIEHFNIPEKDIFKQDIFFYKVSSNLTPSLNQLILKYKKMFFYRTIFLLIGVLIWLLTEVLYFFLG